MSAGDLAIWDVPYVFDVIVGDFGRGATMRLVTSVSQVERDFIRRAIVNGTGRDTPFFDEYRRIMFACVGDLAYIKRDLIDEYASAGKRLDSDILFGVGGTSISGKAISAITDVIAGPVRDATERGYRNIRVVMPCNTLAKVERELVKRLTERFPTYDVALSGMDQMGAEESVKVRVYSVPRIVLEHVVDASPRLMLIGTALSREVYRSVLDEIGAATTEIVKITRAQQDLMNRLVVASIGGNGAEISLATSELERGVLRRLKTSRGGSFAVIQASTDLDISIGTNSLGLLARQLVTDAYSGAM